MIVATQEILTLREMLSYCHVRVGYYGADRGWEARGYLSHAWHYAEGPTPLSAVVALLQKIGGGNG